MIQRTATFCFQIETMNSFVVLVVASAMAQSFVHGLWATAPGSRSASDLSRYGFEYSQSTKNSNQGYLNVDPGYLPAPAPAAVPEPAPAPSPYVPSSYVHSINVPTPYVPSINVPSPYVPSYGPYPCVPCIDVPGLLHQ